MTRRLRVPNSLRLLILTVGLTVIPSVAVAQAPPQVAPGWYLVDDMILPEEALSGDSGWVGTPWPGGVVAYDFDANVSATNRQLTLDAMREWEAAANVTFVLRTTEPNYVHVRSGTGNSSYVGMVGGPQNLTIVNWSLRFKICHELCHALGVMHEHQRTDRAAYITINTANIQPSYAYNFTMTTSTLLGPYDLDSVMHYDQCGLSIDCAAGSTCSCTNHVFDVVPPITPPPSGIGQRQHLSILDAQSMAMLYGAPPAPTIATISPISAAAGSPAFTLTITGGKFHPGSNDAYGVQKSVVRWNGTALPTTYVGNPFALTATVPASLLTTVSTAMITVENPAPGAGASVPVAFPIGYPVYLALDQANGTHSFRDTLSTDFPGAYYFRSYSFDPLNVTAPGQGFWFGVHTTIAELTAQYYNPDPLFTGVLDGAGDNTLVFPAGTVPPYLQGLAVAGAAYVWSSSGGAFLGGHGPALLLLQ